MAHGSGNCELAGITDILQPTVLSCIKYPMFVSRRSNDVLLGLYWWMLIIILTCVFINFVFSRSGKIRHDPLIIIIIIILSIIIIISSSSSSSSSSKGKVILL